MAKQRNLFGASLFTIYDHSVSEKMRKGEARFTHHILIYLFLTGKKTAFHVNSSGCKLLRNRRICIRNLHGKGNS